MAQSNFQIILSTDGKHTIIAQTDQLGMTAHAQAWATATYDQLVKRYGLKHEQYQKGNNGNGNQGEEVPVCAVHKVPMVRQRGKYGEFWSCHERDADGRFCTYRPNGG
jgi:hypothetical protein